MENDKVVVSNIIDIPLKNIWQKYNNLDIKLMERKFLAPKFITCNSILFLGINPSFSGSTQENENTETVFYYELSKNNIEHPYFSSFSKVVENHNWEHLDLLFFRETNQKKVDELIKKQPGGLSFICDQLILSKQLIELSKPKIIVASNTKVRQLLGAERKMVKGKEENIWMGYSFEFDELIGTHRIKTEGSLYSIPIFFTSMLSGQRALDRGSFERLQWHVNFVLKKIK